MSSIGSPKIIPRVHLSPKIKQRVRNPQFKKQSPVKGSMIRKNLLMRNSPLRTSPGRYTMLNRASPAKGSIKLSPKKSMRVKSPIRTKAFIQQREKFRNKPTVNPNTNRTIKIGGDTYNKLTKLYGNPY